MDLCIEDQLRWIKTTYDDIMTSDQKKQHERLAIISREVSKMSQDVAKNGCKHPPSSLVEQIQSLQRRVKGNKKSGMTDYEAFRWKIKRENPRTILPDSFQLLQIDKKPLEYPADSQLLQFRFSPLPYCVQQLCWMGSYILHKNEFFFGAFKDKTILRLVRKMADEYNITSYHNFTHAFSVLLLLHQINHRIEALKVHYTPFELGMAYLAALAHDMGHKGFNNLYEIKKKSDLAITYNNTSVLENMHVFKFFNLMREDTDLDLLTQIKDPILREKAKKLITGLILSTDMSRHFGSMENLDKKIKKGLDHTNQEDKELVLETIFHACDIGNPCLPFQEYMNWAILLSYQFDNQTLKEQKQGLQVTTFLKYKDLGSFYKGQIGFINSFSLPIWKQITEIYPRMEELVQKMVQNIEELEKRGKN